MSKFQRPADPVFNFYFPDAVQMVGSEGLPVTKPILHNYQMETKPSVIFMVHTVQEDGQPVLTDWRFRDWVTAVQQGLWPPPYSVHVIDIFVEMRSTHICEWRLHTAWPLLECQHSSR
jgi:hypothetical protein